MIMEAKGVDTSKLTEAQTTSFYQMINVEPSACDKPHSLATSLRDDASCRDSMIVSQFISDRLAAGIAMSDIKVELDEVRDALKVREINIEGRPVFGNERAPVTVVVFADFECPHCKAEAPLLREAVQQYRGQAKLVYKHFPLQMHARARVAAIATEAAHEQGKFWEMHDQVFGHQSNLEDADLMRYAQDIGLDMAKFKASFSAKKGEAAVDADRAEGEKLGIMGTPAVYVNGRMFTPMLFGGTVAGWIDDALRR
jgi:protein-disulfide isomerase